MENNNILENGPDQIFETSNLTTIDRNGYIKLQIEESWKETKPISIPTFVKKNCERGGDRIALVIKRENVLHKWTYKGYYKDIRTVAKAFIHLGLEPRQGVAILGSNSPEWIFSQLAGIFAGGISTGIYVTSIPDACKHVINGSQANIVVVEDSDQLEKIMAVKDQLTHVKAIVQYTGIPMRNDVYSWEQVITLGSTLPDDELEDRLRRICINQCCFLPHTSGTSGQPKAAMICHDTITNTVGHAKKLYKFREDVYVSYLPLCHVAANMTDIFLMIDCLCTVHFARKDALRGTLVDTLKEVQPTIFLGVPRVYEKIQEKMQDFGRTSKGLKKQIGDWAKITGLQHNRFAISCGNPHSGTSLQFLLADKLVFQNVKKALGLERCNTFYSGAAPLSLATRTYFLSLNINIWQLYGLTETCGPHFSEAPGQAKWNSVGKPYPGFKTKLVPLKDDSCSADNSNMEIWMKGRHIMMGYLNDPVSTKKVINDEGWFNSGDIGAFDEQGFFTITGRSKELIITAGGENIPPTVIEAAIKKELPCLSNVMLIGDQRKFLTCLLTFKSEMDPTTQQPLPKLAPGALAWCLDHGSKASKVSDVTQSQDHIVDAAIQEGIDRANVRAISRAQRVQKWAVLPEDFSLPGGELGPTMKLKRFAVLKKYHELISSFYQ